MSDPTGAANDNDAASPLRGSSRNDAQDAARRARLSELLEATARGEQTAFAELYRLASGHLFAVIVRMVHDRGEAEDLLQEVFTAAWRRADLFDAARGGAMTWLVTLARNRAIDRLRQQRETQFDDTVADALPDEAPTPAARAEASEDRLRLERCMQQLEPTQRGVIRDAFFSGATYSELAARMSVPLGTLKSWIRRSLMQLKTCLGQ
ncbi:sigma-70 family RNA polymerase sigma factor [Paraburkholderia sp. J76]|uniref:sigma-70 family RNA polymerase sigma factor n=1 Tax=Paraburkholderia sp. J76 TaxID=2805439 RepID=UPI002ABD1C88|nr:sigma-70 family RNA polymerase sigma factor [Paraburkholderia sp. J76]